MPSKNFYEDKVVLITGGVGSIGSEIVKKLLKCNPKVLRVFDNNETGLFYLGEELQSKKIELFLGDLRDKGRLEEIMKNVDIVFHVAALKHVPLCESNPFEAVKTNVLGTQNVIDAALKTNVKKVINISTDKAVNPINVMGATKLLAEKLIKTANFSKGKNNTIFASVRLGNVFNSRGSLMPLLQEQIKKNRVVTITDFQMTRFVMSISKAVNLILKSGEMANEGETFILKMPALRTGDLINFIIKKVSVKCGYNPKQIKIKLIGKRNGEKKHEELIREDEKANICEKKEMFIILPERRNKKIQKTFNKINYSSKDQILLDKKEIEKMLNNI